MRFEETPEHLIFRNVTIAKEMIQQYPDGKLVKTSEELIKADKLSQEEMPVIPYFDGHKKERLVGFALPPKGRESFANGKLKRDVFFDKDTLSQNEIQDVRRLPYSKKKDVSIGFHENTDYQKTTWRGHAVDGFMKDIKIDHLSWEQLGRCTTADGCGLTRSDKMRVDGISFDAAADECVSKKVKIFSQEHPEWGKDKVVAAAMDFCRTKSHNKKDGGVKMDTVKIDGVTFVRADIQKQDAGLPGKEQKLFLSEAQKEIVTTLEQHEKEEKTITKLDVSDLIEKVDSLTETISQFVKAFQPKTDAADSPGGDANRTDADSVTTEEQPVDVEAIIKDRFDALEKNLKEQIAKIPMVPRRFPDVSLETKKEGVE